MIFVQNLNIVSRNSFRHRARQSWKNFAKLLLVEEISSDGPPCLRLPPGIVDNYMWKVLVYPLYGIRITTFSNQSKTINRACIKFLNPFTFIIFFLHNSYRRWGHIYTCDLVLLDFLPNDTCIRCDWLSFKEHASCSSDKWSIYNKRMTNHPTNIT